MKTIPTIELILIVGMVLYVGKEFYVIQILESFYVEIIIFLVIFDGQTPMYSEELLRSEKSLGYVYRLASISDQMLKATLSGDTDRMAEILQLAHNTETPILSYNNETELAAVVNLVYLSARDRYRVEREDKAGKGFVDFIFYPENPADTGLILELKTGHSPEEAIRQIREKQYTLRFRGKPGEKERYTGQILGVGISYDKDTKEHHCKIEQL